MATVGVKGLTLGGKASWKQNGGAGVGFLRRGSNPSPTSFPSGSGAKPPPAEKSFGAFWFFT